MCAVRLLLGAVFILFMTACANDHQRTCTEGAGVGAVAGAAAGNLATGNSKGALAGALIGGIGGAIYGCKVADDKVAYAKREAELKASAERANTAARASKAEAARLSQEVTALDQAMADLRTAKMTAQAKKSTAQTQQRQLAALQQAVDERAKGLNAEIARQNAVLTAARAEAQRVAVVSKSEPAPQSEGLVLVSMGVRELEQQSRALELVKLQLQQIDRRRAY